MLMLVQGAHFWVVRCEYIPISVFQSSPFLTRWRESVVICSPKNTDYSFWQILLFPSPKHLLRGPCSAMAFLSPVCRESGPTSFLHFPSPCWYLKGRRFSLLYRASWMFQPRCEPILPVVEGVLEWKIWNLSPESLVSILSKTFLIWTS